MQIRDGKVKSSTLLKSAYLIIFGMTIIYVKNVLDTDSFKAMVKTPQRRVVTPKDVTVVLVTNIAGMPKEYRVQLKNTDSVENLLHELRDAQGLYYESDLYTYGTEIISVFGKDATPGKRWAVLSGGRDITNNISNETLADKAVYELVQITE